MNEYKSLEMNIICLEDDCIRTSGSDFTDYNENELPLVPFN